MKRLCCSNFSTLTLLLNVSLMASLSDKSTMIYCGENISYLMVGIHDYIVVNSENTNTITHEFSAYKHKMYIHISQDTNELESVTNARFKEGCEKFFLNMRDSALEKQEIAK